MRLAQSATRFLPRGLLLAAAAPQVSPQLPPRLERRAGEWTITTDPINRGCTIANDFTVQSRPITITLGLALNGGVTGTVSFAQDTVPNPNQGLALLTQLPDGGGSKVAVTVFRDPRTSRVAVDLVMDWTTQRSFLARLPSTTAFRLDNRRRVYDVEVGPMRSAFRRLVTCHNVALQAIGVDPNAMIYLPPLSADRWIGPADLPAGSHSDRGLHRAMALVDIDRVGRPIGCRMLVSADRADINAAICRALSRHAKYAAATGDDPATRYNVVGVVLGL